MGKEAQGTSPGLLGWHEAKLGSAPGRAPSRTSAGKVWAEPGARWPWRVWTGSWRGSGEKGCRRKWGLSGEGGWHAEARGVLGRNLQVVFRTLRTRKWLLWGSWCGGGWSYAEGLCAVEEARGGEGRQTASVIRRK